MEKASSLADHMSLTAAQLAALHKTDAVMAERVAVVIQQLDSINGELTRMKGALAEKDMSRVAVIEAELQAAKEQRTAEAAEAKADHETVMGWIRAIALTVFSAACAIASQLWLSSRRDKRHTLQVETVRDRVDIIGDSVDGVASNLTGLKRQTDGMTDRIERMATDKGFREGKDAGIQQERDKPSE